MAKSKQSGPALFDLLGPTQDDVTRSLRVPEAAAPKKSGAATLPPKGVPPASLAERAIVPGRSRRPNPSPDEPSPPARIRRRLIRVDDECVQLSLTSVGAAVAVFVLLVGVLGMYELGRTNGRSDGYAAGYRVGRLSFEADAASEIEAARQQPPASHVVEGLLQSSAGRAMAPSATAADNTDGSPAADRVFGHTYVVAQEFGPRAERDAISAQSYLEGQGIDTTIIRLETGRFQLVTTQGFDRSDSVQRGLADRLLAAVQRVGRDYYARGSGYKLEGYFKTWRNKSR